MLKTTWMLGLIVVACQPMPPPAMPAQSLAPPDTKQEQHPAFLPIEDDPDLPRVLIIGDSISIGYTVPTRAGLKGVANLHRPLENCGPTLKGRKEIDDWLGEGSWDVIHFNWGLHDLKYDAPSGKQKAPIADYERNLDLLLRRMKKTGAKLIWCTTTPVPEGAKERRAGDAAKYNEAAARVMDKHGVQTHDLYTFAKRHQEEIQIPQDVHFTLEGSKRLAAEVVQSIRNALEQRTDDA